MAFDFPASPTTGQVYTSGGVSYAWNGAAWVQGGASTAVPIPDAPSDSKAYARKNTAWIDIARESGAVKAWASILPRSTSPGYGTASLESSFNTTGITDAAAGLTAHHFTAVFANTLFCHLGSLNGSGVGNNMALETKNSSAATTAAGASGLRSLSSTAVTTDPQNLFSAVLGTLA